MDLRCKTAEVLPLVDMWLMLEVKERSTLFSHIYLNDVWYRRLKLWFDFLFVMVKQLL